MNYLNGLNEKQKEAVLMTEGPLLIVAGAGAGKTKTITHRIIHLIHEGIPPEEILAITFTNKAAKEMRDRVFSMMKEKGYEDLEEVGVRHDVSRGAPFLSTFHSLGVYIIKENSHLIGLNKYFKIADDGDTLSIIKDILKENDLDPKQNEPRKIKNIISRAKGDFVDVETYEKEVKSGFGSIVAFVWKRYEERLKKEKSLDFDDLLLKSVNILKKFKNVRNHYLEKWKYIHIDEYQDTNGIQYEMVKLLTGEKENLCVVGDTDQNIYGWRGANIKNMLHFEKDYPKAKIVMLEQNYRSTKNILSAANKIISKNQYRIPKNLFTENEIGETISIAEAYDELNEARFVADNVVEILKENEAEDIAVLYRANFQSRVLEEAFLEYRIPYQVLGVKFFERKEVKDILSYIRASLNKDSLSDIKRIINIPARGIGKTTILKIFSGQKDTLPESMKEKINKFYLLLDEINQFINTNKPSEVIKFIIEKSGILEKYKHGTTDEQEDLENMQELASLALKYDNFWGEKETIGIEKLLEDASLSSDQDTLIDKKKGVRLMTVHASKGLEFKYVFVTGLEQDLFPHTNGERSSKEDTEEERRLFYVAITRARHKLYLTYSSLRTIFGTKQVNTPSEFIYDIPSEVTTFEQVEYQGNEKVVYL